MRILDSHDTVKMHMVSERSNTRTGRGNLFFFIFFFYYCKIDPRNTTEEPPIHYFVMAFPSAFRINKVLKKPGLAQKSLFNPMVVGCLYAIR
jgi:hypothetical protein